MAKQETSTIKIDGMHCASCVSSVESGVRQVVGVSEVSVNLATGAASVKFDSAVTSADLIMQKIRDIGYGARPGQADLMSASADEIKKAARRMWIGLALAIPLMAVAMGPMLWGEHHHPVSVSNALIQAALAALILIFAGAEIFKDAFNQTRHRRANMNSLIAMGSLAAFGWSIYATVFLMQGIAEELYFESAGMIVALILVGRYLEARSKSKAGEAIKALVGLRPTKALAVINGVEIEIDAASLQRDMIFLVRPGERVAADGVVVEGSPSIDESMLTGESMPVDKNSGDAVLGGSVNGNSAFKVRVTATGEQSFLSSVIRLVADAQARKAPVQYLADKIASVFVPVVIGIATITAIIWWLVAPDSALAVKSVVSVLIIACPCALGLATPTAVLAGTGRAAREGIIMRGGDVVEKLSTVSALLFDKTGTLTTGKVRVVKVVPTNGRSDQELLQIAGSAESQSEHPIARSIAGEMISRKIEPIKVWNVFARPGLGLTAECADGKVLIGSEAYLKQRDVDVTRVERLFATEREAGCTVIGVAVGGELIGIISVADTVRDEAPAMITHLGRDVSKIVMVTGDNEITARAVAREAGIETIECEVRPAQKQDLVKKYQSDGYRVAMVGDGINDAPALAAADVGIAMGSGTDVAIESADAILARPSLDRLAAALELSKQTMRVIRQNLFWAFAYNLVAIPIAAGALYPIWGMTLSPMIAALAMSLSSVFVVTNALRLNRVKVLSGLPNRKSK